VGWPTLATIIEAWRATAYPAGAIGGTGSSVDPVGSTALLRESGGKSRPVRLAEETLLLVGGTEAIALPLGILLAFLLFRTDVLGKWLVLFLLSMAAFVPLPLVATAWLGALGNAGRLQVFGSRPILVGLTGAAVVHALAALPWVVLIAGVGLCAVEPELEESALLDYGPVRVFWRVTLRRAVGAIAAAALAVMVLVGGDMTITDILQIRTYAEEAYLQYSLGKGPGAAAIVAIPPLVLLSLLILVVCRVLGGIDPGRIVSAIGRARVWKLGRWRTRAGVMLLVVIGNMIALPVYSLLWRAGRVGGRAKLGRPPGWSLEGLRGTLERAAIEIAEPMQASLAWTAAAATLTAGIACTLAWAARGSVLWRCVAFVTLALTLAAPGPIAGMALVLAYRDFSLIYDSPVRVVLAESLRSLPYALLLIWPFLRSFPQEYLDAAALDGHGPWGQVVRVVVPLSLRPILAAWAVAFAIGLGELPATNLNAPAGTLPMSVLIWGLLHTGVDSHLAGVALLMLLVVSGAGLFAAAAVRSLRRITLSEA
jgi:iron(III) transport system permease protein